MPLGLDLTPLLAKIPGRHVPAHVSFRRPHVACPRPTPPGRDGARAPSPGRGRGAGAELLGLLAENESGTRTSLREPQRSLPPRLLPPLLRPRHARRAQRAGVRHRPDRQGREPNGLVLVQRPSDGPAVPGRRRDRSRLPAADARHGPDGPRRAWPRCPAERPASSPPCGTAGRRLPAAGRRLRPPRAHFDMAGEVVEGPEGVPLRRARGLAPRRHDPPHVRALGPPEDRARGDTPSPSSCATRAARSSRASRARRRWTGSTTSHGHGRRRPDGRVGGPGEGGRPRPSRRR